MPKIIKTDLGVHSYCKNEMVQFFFTEMVCAIHTKEKKNTMVVSLKLDLFNTSHLHQ